MQYKKLTQSQCRFRARNPKSSPTCSTPPSAGRSWPWPGRTCSTVRSGSSPGPPERSFPPKRPSAGSLPLEAPSRWSREIRTRLGKFPKSTQLLRVFPTTRCCLFSVGDFVGASKTLVAGGFCHRFGFWRPGCPCTGLARLCFCIWSWKTSCLDVENANGNKSLAFKTNGFQNELVFPLFSHNSLNLRWVTFRGFFFQWCVILCDL